MKKRKGYRMTESRFILRLFPQNFLEELMKTPKTCQESQTPAGTSIGPRCEEYHSPSASAEVKNAWVFTSTFPTHLYGMVLN
jgi:hypothetical protein